MVTIIGLILFSRGRLIVNFPISTDYYIYDLEGTLLSKIERLDGFEIPKPMGSSEDKHEHFENQAQLFETELYCEGKYVLQAGGSKLRAPSDDPSSLLNLIYDQDFKRVQILRVGKRLYSFGGEYLYSTISNENSEVQYLERYKLVDSD